MFPHWNVIGPLLAAADPRTIVEIGVCEGGTTSALLKHAAAHDAVVHGIDPAPAPVVDELVHRHAGRFVLHRGRSLEVLPRLDSVDCVLIDGDHNWYTVLNELRLLARIKAPSRLFPLVFAHDVGWPYGRRDMYYDPETIPSEHRQQWRRGGMIPGQSELSDDTGLSRDGCNAVAEGTPRNGVRTAIEDFIAESDVPLRFEVLEGFFGLGILISGDEVASNERLRESLAVVESPEFLEGQSRRLEAARVEGLARRRGRASS
ncbi:MAG: class I SAM-dependent methyltransferase [Solirubrobacterales bacterium]